MLREIQDDFAGFHPCNTQRRANVVFARGLFICQRNRQMFEGISGAFQVCAGRIQTLRS